MMGGNAVVCAVGLVKPNDHEDYKKLLQLGMANENPWAPPMAPKNPSSATQSQDQVPPPSRSPFPKLYRVVQPDAVCEVGGSTPDLSYGDLGIFLGGGHCSTFTGSAAGRGV